MATRVGLRFSRDCFRLACGLLGVGVLGLAGCGGSGQSGPPITQAQVTVSGGGQVRLGSTAQFTATVTGETNSAVTWQVNGVNGGSAGAGTISAAGPYTPPGTIPGGATSGLLTVMGTGFVSGSQVQAAGTNQTTTLVSATELQATVPLGTGVTTVNVDVVNPDPGGTTSTVASAQVQASLQSASRLLDQATFGPTLTDIAQVQAVGLQGYLNEQFAMTPTLEPDIATPPPALCATSTIPCQQAEWWQAALTAPDQLRQRVAFAMSETFVISTNSDNARTVTTYQNTLVNDAFGNFYTMMKDVTLSPGMGAYLNMLNSAKPGTIGGVLQIANENYAREF